jgi:hypothetical protein
MFRSFYHKLELGCGIFRCGILQCRNRLLSAVFEWGEPHFGNVASYVATE